MIPVKTAAGQQVLKDRSVALTPRQRAALVVIDGKRTVAEVAQCSGVTREDVARLLELALVTDAALETAAPAGAVPPVAAGPTPRERYAAAYPIASQLTASLGLRGVRLNLAVEGATSYEDLLALAPKIREAVGKEKAEPLEAALRAR